MGSNSSCLINHLLSNSWRKEEKKNSTSRCKQMWAQCQAHPVMLYSVKLLTPHSFLRFLYLLVCMIKINVLWDLAAKPNHINYGSVLEKYIGAKVLKRWKNLLGFKCNAELRRALLDGFESLVRPRLITDKGFFSQAITQSHFTPREQTDKGANEEKGKHLYVMLGKNNYKDNQ